uniref:VWFC domain-containing protein n=1 Tax=Heliothis virescens TaxID=7102 RepID=A0A2A4K1M5_HELVI
MDRRRAAGALLALAACIACSAAAPTASNHTALDLYEGAPEGCYYNFQHYGEGDRIMTNEPCLNCTCHNRMLMCYLRVCPFTKAIGQDCTVEKRADQCCPIVTCPDVPVDLLTSTSTTSPAEYGATGLGKLDKYGCSISGKYFPEGSKVPPTPNKPCEHCYCIRNMTTCVMQECTLHVDGCTPIYHKDVCCPVRYSCDHPEDEVPLLDDMSTTVRPTPGFLLTTTTMAPVTQMTQDCVHDDQVFADGALIKTEKACEHCYCMKGDIVCVVQECGAPMENEGKNCTSLPPREGQCCPDTYICDGDELTSDLPTESTTDIIVDKPTSLLPPRRTNDEGSGYRNEPDEVTYTELPVTEPEVEGSGDDQETSKPQIDHNEMIPGPEDGEQYIYVTTKAPGFEKHELTTTEIDRNVTPESGIETEQPHIDPSSTIAPISEDKEKLSTSISGLTEENILEPHKYAPTTSIPETFESITTELGESQNTVPDEIAGSEVTKAHDYAPSTTTVSTSVENESLPPVEGEDNKPIPEEEKDVTMSTLEESTKPEYNTLSSAVPDDSEKEISTSIDISNVTPEVMTEYSEADILGTTVSSEQESVPEGHKDFKPELTTSNPLQEDEKPTTEVDHALNTVAVSEEETPYPHSHVQATTISSTVEEESATVNIEKDIVTDKDLNENVILPHEPVTTSLPALEETEPDRGMNTIPSETNEESSSESSLAQKTTTTLETQGTDEIHTQGMEVKSTTSAEVPTLSPESITTKVDQSTITTEPSFRKEDDIIVSTEKTRETEQTTVKSEFIDEGLIPTSSHDEKTDTSSKVPSMEEEFTTSIPEYVTEISETTDLKETTVSTQDSIVTDKTSEPSYEQDGDLPSSTEKMMEVTPFHQENVDIQEEPSRIPGEGDCLLNGITYRNNSVVPSTNNCHTGCRCASSIIKCDPIICSPPPDYMDNCQSIYDSPDSCCPTYVCDHPRETVPPQSDNQMSGTESPISSPTIECRGDQCEISQPTKQPAEQFDLKPTTKPEIECGSEGCSDDTHKSDTGHPSGVQSEKCPDGKCGSEGCVNGNCDLPQNQGHVSAIKPCEGEHCEKIDEGMSESPQLCKNEQDCKPSEIPTVSGAPCQGESCEKLDCGESGCEPHAAVTPSEKPDLCKENNNCKTQDIPASDCSGDEPCRRKEIPTTDEKIPSACEGSDCLQEQVPTASESPDSSSTESPKIDQTPFKEITEMPEPGDVEKVTEIPDERVSTEETDTYTTESQTGEGITVSEKEQSAIKDEATKKPPTTEDITTESPVIIDETDKDKPSYEAELTDKPATESPDVIEPGITESAIIHEKDQEPVIIDNETEKPASPSDDGEKEPVIYETDGTPKPTIIEQGTQLPTVATEVDTENIAIVDEDSTGKPLITEYYPDSKDEATTTSSILEEESSSKPETGERNTDAPTTVDQENTSESILEADKDKPSFVDSDDKEKPDTINKDITEKPSKTDEGADKPITDEKHDKPIAVTTEETYLTDIEATDKPAYNPDVTEEQSTPKPISTDEEKTPIDSEKEITEQPVLVTETVTEITGIIDNESDKKPAISSSDNKEEVAITDGGVEKPTPIEDEKMKPEVDGQEETEKPVTDHEDGEDKPIQEKDGQKEPTNIGQDGTEKPIPTDEVSPQKTSEVEDQYKEKPPVIVEDKTDTPFLDNEEKTSEMPQTSVDGSTEEPIIVEKDTEKPVVANIDDKQKTTLAPEDEKDTSSMVETNMTEKPVIEKESTETPTTVTEAVTIKPTTIGIIRESDDKEKPTTINTTIKPFVSEEESTLVPDVSEDKNTVKPTIFDEGTEEPIIVVKEDTTESGDIENETTKLPPSTEDVDTKKPIIIDGDTEVDINTEEPVTDEKTTYKPAITKEEDMIEPTTSKGQTIDEESSEKPYVPQKETTVAPTISGEVVTDKPVLIDEEGNIKPVDEEHTQYPDLKDKDKPAIIDNNVTDKPDVNEAETTENIYEGEGSGSEAPIVPQTSESDKEQSTEEAIHKIEKSTTTPSYAQTTVTEDREHELSTDINLVGTETPEKKVTQYEDKETNEPTEKLTSSDHSLEITTETPLTEQDLTTSAFNVPEQEKVTINNQDIEGTTPKYDITDTKGDEASTTRRDLIGDEVSSSTKDPQLYETPVSVEKTTETIIEHSSASTETAGIESPTTLPPDDGSDIVQPDKPKPLPTSETEESTTKIYDEGTVKPIPESHITESSSTSSEYSTSAEVTEASEVKDEDKDKTVPNLPEEHSIKPDGYSTQLPIDIVTDHPEVHSSERDDAITDSPVSSATEPERRYTEVEDPSVTGHEEISTGYPEHATEPQAPSVTEKVHVSPGIDEVSSEKPLSTDSDISSEEPEKITESDKPVTETSEMVHHASEVDKKKPTDEFESLTTEIPIVTVTETQDTSNIPEQDVTISEEKATVSPDISDHTEKETIPEQYTEKQESSTEVPHRHTTEAQESESYTTESSETRAPDASTQSEKQVTTETLVKATDAPNVSEKEEVTVTEVPEVLSTEPQDLDKKEPSITEKQEQATELPTPVDDERTESSSGKITTDVPQSLVTGHKDILGEPTTVSNLPIEESSKEPELLTTQSEESSKVPEHYDGQEDIKTERPVEVTESLEVTTKVQEDRITQVSEEALPEAHDTKTTLRESPPVTEEITKVEDAKPTEPTSAQTEFSETTPYLIELEEHTHKIQEEIATVTPTEEHTDKAVEEKSPSSPTEEDIPTSPSPSEDDIPKIEKQPSTGLPFEEKYTTVVDLVTEQDLITRISDDGFETATKPSDTTTKTSEEVSSVDVSEKIPDSEPVKETTAAVTGSESHTTAEDTEFTTAPVQVSEESTSTGITESSKPPVSESDIGVATEKEIISTEKPEHSVVSHETTTSEEEFIFSTSKATTERQEEDIVTPAPGDKFEKPSEKPGLASDVPPSSTTTEISKPSGSDLQPTDEVPVPDEFPSSGTSGYGEPDYVEEDQAFGPGTCRYGGKVYVSAQQIPRDDPCDFCFCFRSDIICLQQSCPPPIHGCHEEPIQGFCCPRYECPVSMATTVNVTTTTTTTTTTLPPHFPTHSYKGAAHRRGCQIKGHTYKVGEVVRSSSGPCLHCTCGGDGQMKCDPKACTPEPMLRQMIAAAVSAKRRR